MKYIFFQKAHEITDDNWICIITLKQHAKTDDRQEPSTLMQICAKQIFRLMSGITDQFFDLCYSKNLKDKQIKLFVKKYYNVNFNLKPLDFIKIAEEFFAQAFSIFDRLNLHYNGTDPMASMDETIFFSNG